MTVRLVITGDTHMPRRGRGLPARLLTEIERADAVVHLGDFVEMEVVELFRGLSKLYAVHGNNDSDEIQLNLPPRMDIRVEGHRIALIHGHVGGRTAREAAQRIDGVDAVLFGHSHRAYQSQGTGTLLLNPGSPTEQRWSPYRSFALLEVDEAMAASIVQVP